ncbi:MAG TPA: fatty acid desaturase [Candidatus Polarisedimenticolia bacterium]|jgi:fatty acid desaturase
MDTAASIAMASTLSPVKTHHYGRKSTALRQKLAMALPREELRRLHVRQPWRHHLVSLRQLGLLALSSYMLWRFTSPLVWVPFALVQGFTIFNFTVLLHEVVHETVTGRFRPWLTRLLGVAYSFPSGISHLQFTRWHLDHHDNLGSSTEDPKRFHLSPKRNARWYKLLYFTPALFVIYFRAARREMATYPAQLQRRIAFERNLTILGHVAILAALWGTLGPLAMLRIYLVPYFFVFPIAFAMNRMGQHYYINPANPAQWSTLVKSSLFWNFAFLWSNFHLEHHYFPRVPFYNLPRLHRLLAPFYRGEGMKPVGYGTLIYGWLFRNGAPHSDWSLV